MALLVRLDFPEIKVRRVLQVPSVQPDQKVLLEHLAKLASQVRLGPWDRQVLQDLRDPSANREPPVRPAQPDKRAPKVQLEPPVQTVKTERPAAPDPPVSLVRSALMVRKDRKVTRERPEILDLLDRLDRMETSVRKVRRVPRESRVQLVRRETRDSLDQMGNPVQRVLLANSVPLVNYWLICTTLTKTLTV